MFDWIADPNAWVALATLTALEIVLGVDNIIFISILVGRLPPEQRDLARRLGLTLAMGSRTGCCCSRIGVDHEADRAAVHRAGAGHLRARPDPDRRRPVPAVEERARDPQQPGRRGRRRGPEGGASAAGRPRSSFVGVLVQIAIIDIVFSLDSVITAVGLAEDR